VNELRGDYVRRVDHTEEGDRALLRRVFLWAACAPALYLDGGGYHSVEDFLAPPLNSFEYFVFIDDRPAALLTLMRLGSYRKVYQVGLITDPDASLRKICKLLLGFMGAVFEVIADALFVDLPDSPDFAATRKLARFFGLAPVSQTNFILFKSQYGIKKPTSDPQK
jgi:hypothetical protein